MAAGADTRDAPSVVVPTWQRAEWLGVCLAALRRQTLPPREVVVVGRREDEAARRAHLDPARPCVLRGAPCHVAPVKAGLAAAEGEIVAFLDDDAEPDGGWLEAIAAPFADPLVACVGGRVLQEGAAKVKEDSGRLRWYGEHVANVGAIEAQGMRDVDGVMEGNWAWRTSVLRQLPFDEALDFAEAPMYGLDLCLEAKRRGHRVVYSPAARVVHHAAPRDPGLAREDRPRRVYAYSRNYTYVMLKHLRGPRRAAFAAWWLLAGDRGSPGLARTVVALLRRRGGVAAEARAAASGKLAGARARVRSR